MSEDTRTATSGFEPYRQQHYYAGAAEDGSLFLEWTRPDGSRVGLFLETLPKTVVVVREGIASRVIISSAEQLALLIDAHAGA